jgi:hypothetical protein
MNDFLDDHSRGTETRLVLLSQNVAFYFC